MLRAQSRVLGLALALAGAFGPTAAHAQYGGYGGGYGDDSGGYNPFLDPTMTFGFGPDVGPARGKSAPAPNPVLQLLALANHPAVQDDLKLTDDQKAKLKDLAPKRPAGKRKPGSGSRKPAARPGRAKAASDAVAAQQKQLGDILKSDQRKRLGQIALQVEGPLAVARSEVAKKINLSAAQVKQVRSIVGETRDQIEQLGPLTPPQTDTPPPGGDPGQPDQPPDLAQLKQARQAAERLQKAAVARVTKVLKPAQKDAFNELLGKPFDVARLRASQAPADAAAGQGEDAVGPKSRPDPQPQPQP